jgi:1-acyl-sn-glycerol-3-phosphate acyltransferase
MIRTFAVLLLFTPGVVLLGPLLVLWTVIVGSPDLMYWTAQKFIRLGARVAAVGLKVEGLENIPARVCVFAANHASNIDPLALIISTPTRVGILVKRELFRIPILAAAMRVSGYVRVDRASKQAAAGIGAAVQTLKRGLSLLVFVEGTRSVDGRLQSFKKGAFAMAIQAKVPIVPVSIAGTQHILRKGAWSVHPGEVTIRFAPAVDASGYTIDRRPELIARVRAQIAADLPADQRPLAGSPSAPAAEA